MIRVGIVGATGYGGRELLRLLVTHPQAEVVSVTSTTAVGEPVGDTLPGLRRVLALHFEAFDAKRLSEQCDVVFVGVPGAESMGIVRDLREAGCRVIDIGPDFRLKDLDAFKQYYKHDHVAPGLVPDAAYGFAPFHRDAIAKADLVAAPGCYPISALVPLRPLVAAAPPDVPVVIDSVSGISGAGRSLKEGFHFPEMNENVWAYKVGAHQHTPEIEQELGFRAQVQFTPHVGPYTRGILTTITYRTSQSLDLDSIYKVYADEPFIRVLGAGNLPELRYVRASNFCDFGWVKDDRTGNLILVSAVDNLFGGTAGAAIQCMNGMFALDETTGLLQGGMMV